MAARDQSGGEIAAVSDQEILEAYRLLAQEEGIFAEPASAAAVAGFIKVARQRDLSGQRAVCIVTGSGLKDPEAAETIPAHIVPVAAELGAVERALALV